jgi:hypothetical protein
MALIQITRGPGYGDGLRAYRIVIDGEQRGKIGRGETVDIEVPSGPHELVLKIDWCRSPRLSFTVADRALFTCGPNRISPALRRLFHPTRWIDLRQDVAA